MDEIAQVIVAIREAMGLSQDGFARKLELSRTTVANWEQGRRNPGRESVRLLFERLDPPHCWTLLAAAGLPLKEIVKKLGLEKEHDNYARGRKDGIAAGMELAKVEQKKKRRA